MKGNRFRSFLVSNQPFEMMIDRDFVDDALEDDHLPDPGSIDELVSYLSKQGATDKALVAAYRAWQLYDQNAGKGETRHSAVMWVRRIGYLFGAVGCAWMKLLPSGNSR